MPIGDTREGLTVSAMKTVLLALPRTLNETYSRILANIPIDYIREAQVIFQFLSVSYGPMSLEALAEAVAIDTHRNEFHIKTRLFNK